MGLGTPLVVQTLGLRVPNAGAQVLIPGQGTRTRMLQLRVLVPHLRSSAVKERKEGRKR